MTDLSLPFLACFSLRASSAQPLSVGCEIRAENDIIYTHELLQTEKDSLLPPHQAIVLERKSSPHHPFEAPSRLHDFGHISIKM